VIPTSGEIFRKEEVLLGTLSHQVRFAREYQEIGVKSPSSQRVQDHVDRVMAGFIPARSKLWGIWTISRSTRIADGEDLP